MDLLLRHKRCRHHGDCACLLFILQQGHTGNLWSDAVSSHEALLDALDVLVKHSSWRDSIVALLIWPVLWSLRYIGASWLWLWRRQGLRLRWALNS